MPEQNQHLRVLSVRQAEAGLMEVANQLRVRNYTKTADGIEKCTRSLVEQLEALQQRYDDAILTTQGQIQRGIDLRKQLEAAPPPQRLREIADILDFFDKIVELADQMLPGEAEKYRAVDHSQMQDDLRRWADASSPATEPETADPRCDACGEPLTPTPEQIRALHRFGNPLRRSPCLETENAMHVYRGYWRDIEPEQSPASEPEGDDA